jgi:hypothetical protein
MGCVDWWGGVWRGVRGRQRGKTLLGRCDYCLCKVYNCRLLAPTAQAFAIVIFLQNTLARGCKALYHRVYGMMRDSQQMACTTAYQAAGDQRRSVAHDFFGGANTGHALAVVIHRTSGLHKTVGAPCQLARGAYLSGLLLGAVELSPVPSELFLFASFICEQVRIMPRTAIICN